MCIRDRDLMALFPVGTNPRWRPPPSWKNFKWPYLRNRSSDPLHVLFQGGVFGDGGSNGAISGWNKFKMASAAILEKFQMAISPQQLTIYLYSACGHLCDSSALLFSFGHFFVICLLLCNSWKHDNIYIGSSELNALLKYTLMSAVAIV